MKMHILEESHMSARSQWLDLVYRGSIKSADHNRHDECTLLEAG